MAYIAGVRQAAARDAMLLDGMWSVHSFPAQLWGELRRWQDVYPPPL